MYPKWYIVVDERSVVFDVTKETKRRDVLKARWREGAGGEFTNISEWTFLFTQIQQPKALRISFNEEEHKKKTAKTV